SLGGNIAERSGCIRAEASKLKGADIVLDMPSVGATENIMLAAVGAQGTTNIHNAAREPEITDLQEFLKQMGVRVQGAGSDLIQIEGSSNLLAPEHTIIPDRIEAGTHLIAAAICGGQVRVENIIPEHLDSLLAKLKEIGAEIKAGSDYLQISTSQPLKAVDIKTLFYPGFPTDLQPQMMALMTRLSGTSVITEMVFENRFKHVSELRRMGADILLEGQTAIVKGVKKLGGAVVEASDLRAGAALVLAALGAENTSIVDSIEHIDRGYENLEYKYRLLGADIKRLPD
ncbi:MAG: UDP-N-acetylglucosamine 1-carboxyvinyltransferase, partial [Clostridia bacterium]|nr:UDP-N-acetylglucosamine 1-carboxyvinyltransferase [Clostridia bacterium]